MWTLILWLFGGIVALSVLATIVAPAMRFLPVAGRALGAVTASTVLAFPIAAALLAVQGSADRDALAVLTVSLGLVLAAIGWVLFAALRRPPGQA